MFLKNSMRPAFAGVSAKGQAVHSRQENGALMYDAANEPDEFGVYNASSAGSAKRASAPARKPKKRNAAPIAIAVAAVAVLLLVAVIVIALLAGGGKDIKYDNNAFVSLCNEDGIWQVMANGKVVGEYEHEIALIPAADRSFAYVIEDTEEGYRVTVTHGKEVVEITPSPVDKVLATASLEVGIVWLDADSGIYLYNEKNGEEKITKDIDLTAAEDSVTYFYISGDAQTVVYTKLDEEKPDVHHLCVYADSNETKLQKNMYPEGISTDGTKIFASAYPVGATTKSLYVLPFTGNDDNDRYLLSDSYPYDSIVAMNTEGDELVFTAKDADALVSTYVVSFNVKKMKDTAEPSRIARGANPYFPISLEPEVACLSTFKKAYFKTTSADNESPVYFVDKDYESHRVSRFAGQFDAKGEYYYYINNDGTLQRADLSDEDYPTEKIVEDILEFELTAKGNIYWINDSYTLMFCDVSKNFKKSRVNDSVTDMSMHKYSNTLYFTIEDAETVYCSKENSSKEPAKFDSVTLTALPYFTDGALKRSFAVFYDVDNDELKLFYTSNGKKLKYLGNCSDVAGYISALPVKPLPEQENGNGENSNA